MRCILNPTAGGGRAEARWSRIEQALSRAEMRFSVARTAARGEATRLTREALAGGERTIVAIGGDGTIHEVVNGFFDDGSPVNPDARLGIIPCGTGSDLVRTLALPSDPAAAAAVLLADRPRSIDLGRAHFMGHDGRETSRFYINSASAGLTGAVMQTLAALPGWLGGSPAYLVATLLTLAKYRASTITLTIDGVAQPPERALMAVIGNGRYFGGGMHVLPPARIDDGQLDLLVLEDQSLDQLLLNFGRIYTGSHLTLSVVQHRQARAIALNGEVPWLIEIDGEQPGTTPARFEVRPGALRILT